MTIVVVSTGGTIASVPESGSDASPSLTGSDLIDATPGLDRYGPLRTKQFSNVPSPHFEIADVARLVGELNRLAAEDDVTGIIVTQGTDVLEESALFADLCYRGSVPVAFTAAMRNPSLPGADGPANLLGSARVVSDSRTTGVVVVMNDRIHDPGDVTKMHTTNPDTFRSPEFGPLGTIDEDRVYWHRKRIHKPTPIDLDSTIPTMDVPAIPVTMDMPTRQIDAHREADAVCLATTGVGHVPPKVIPSLEQLREHEIPIVATSRCPEGRLGRNTYGFEGSERTLQELECLYSPYNLQKTRIVTIVGLAGDCLTDYFGYGDASE